MSAHNFFVSGPKFTKFLSFNRGGSVVNLWICSGDICDQSQTLSKIAPNFGRFLTSQILVGETLPKLV